MRIRKATMIVVLAAAVAAEAAPTNVGVAARKLIVVDRALASGRATTTFVAKDPAIVKGEGDDPASIEATLALAYEGITGNAAGRFEVPRGAYHGTAGWLLTHGSSVKFVNPAAPGGSTVTRLAVVRPGSLLQLRAEGIGDQPFDIVTAGTPAGAVATAFCVTNGSETNCHCSEFPLGRCVHRATADGAGAKLVCRDGIANPDCAMMVVDKTLAVSFAPPGGICGEARSGGPNGTVLRELACGGASTGGGASTVPDAPLPHGFTNLLTARCHSGTCTLGSTTAAQTGSNNNCTDVGCSAGPWMPTSNGGISTCNKRTFLAVAGGSLDPATGQATITTTLETAVTVTGNAGSPCPRCVSGFCGLEASNPGAACTAVNAAGATYECLPYGVALMPYPSGLASLTTATVSASGPAFCPGQDATQPGLNGCFGRPTCDYIEERGVAAGPLDTGPAPATLAAVFCTRATGNGLIDGAADFPGPNAVAMPAIFELRDWLD